MSVFVGDGMGGGLKLTVSGRAGVLWEWLHSSRWKIYVLDLFSTLSAADAHENDEISSGLDLNAGSENM